MQSAQPIPVPRTLTSLPSSGPLSELHYPIDSLTKKPKGFAFVTFMFPENAVKAYAAVDGQVFQVTAQGWWGAAGPRGSGNVLCVCTCLCARVCVHVCSPPHL